MAEEKTKRLVYDIAYLFVLAILIGVSIYFMRKPRVGVLDMNQVVIGLGIQNRIQDDDKRQQNESFVRLDALKEKLRVRLDPLNAQLDRATDEATKNKIKDQVVIVRREFQESAERIAQEYQRRREDLRRNIRAKIDPAIRDVARSRRLDVIIDAEGGRGIFYAHKRADVTSEVVAAVRKAHNTEELMAVDQPSAEVSPLPQRSAPEPVKAVTGAAGSGAKNR